jgi:hypothetical protein
MELLDCTSLDLVSAHQRLGEDARSQVHKILARRLEMMDREDYNRRITQAAHQSSWIEAACGSPGFVPLVRSALQDYLDCLGAWAKGADLAAFSHPALGGSLPNPLQLALLLQHDSYGCQTGLYRQADGGVVLWHTEEDVEPEPGSHFDHQRIFAFRLAGASGPVDVQAFIYPDLLPGPTFAWRSDGYVLAADSLILKPALDLTDRRLANIASWVLLRLGDQVEAEEVIRALGPYLDGLAVNLACPRQGQVQAVTVEYARQHVLARKLPESAGAYLFQTNVFNQRDPVLRTLDGLTDAEHHSFELRQRRTHRALLQMGEEGILPGNEKAFFLKLMASRRGGGMAYANPDVKAHFICRITHDGMEIHLGEGNASVEGVNQVTARLAGAPATSSARRPACATRR